MSDYTSTPTNFRTIDRFCSRCETTKPRIDFSLYSEAVKKKLGWCCNHCYEIWEAEYKSTVGIYAYCRGASLPDRPITIFYADEHKTCSICKEHKSLDSFRRHRFSPDGYVAKCRDCARTPMCDNTRKNLNLPPKCGYRFRKIANSQNNNCRLRNIQGTLTGHELEKYWNAHDGKCEACGSKQDVEFDHVMPKARGGSNDISNIQLLCKICNREKMTWGIDFRVRPVLITFWPWGLTAVFK